MGAVVIATFLAVTSTFLFGLTLKPTIYLPDDSVPLPVFTRPTISVSAGSLGSNQETQEDNEVLIFTPAKLNIELTEREPPPDGVPSELPRVALIGNTSALPIRFTQGVFWEQVPSPRSAVTDPLRFAACGFFSQPAKAVLTLPSNKQQVVILQLYDGSRGCWLYELKWVYGMELGVYKLTIEGDDGNLSYNLAISYPEHPTVSGDGDIINNNELLFAGFDKNEKVILFVYGSDGKDPLRQTFVAKNEIQVDDTGSAVVELKMVGSLAISLNQIAYVVTDKNLQPIASSLPIGAITHTFASHQGSSDRLSVSQISQEQIQIAPALYDRNGTHFAVVISDTAVAVPVYAGNSNSTAAVASLTPGTLVELLGFKVDFSRGQSHLWFRLRTQSDEGAWIEERYLKAVSTRLLPGGLAEIMEVAQYDDKIRRYSGTDVFLSKSPNWNTAQPQFKLISGTIVRLLSSKYDQGEIWWSVLTPEGLRGWLPQYLFNSDGTRYQEVLESLPVEPISVCDGTKPSQLSAGSLAMTAVQGSGLAYYVYDEPNGNKLKAINFDKFWSQVIEGPYCATDNWIWWKMAGNTWVVEIIGDTSKLTSSPEK